MPKIISRLLGERIFLILVITTLVVIWFRQGLILGSGESGLPFYNTQRLLDTVSHTWSDTPLGGSSAVGYASYPFYLVLTFLQSVKIPSFLIQAGFYWLIFVVGTLSIHKLSSLVSSSTPLSRLSASLFYIFNPIVHVAVLHRFQYPLIFFYGFIPLAFLIYLKGLMNKSFFPLIILNLVSIFFSPIFVGPAFLVLLFFVFGFLSIFFLAGSLRKKRVEIFPLVYFLVFAVTFTLMNAWWFFPLFHSLFASGGQGAGLKFFSPSGNVDTFRGISRELESVLSVFRLVPAKFYEGNGTTWGRIYETPFFVILSFFPIFAFVVSLFRKEKLFLFKFFVILTLMIMFFMKGSLPPLGSLSLFLVRSLTFLQVFRNPFEKIGLLLPFAMAIPVGLGMSLLFDFVAKKVKFSNFILPLLFLFLVFPVYMFPIVNGFVFTGGAPPADDIRIGQYVKVPDYYQQAREWLNRKTGLFRVLVLPLDGEGMTYKWEYGYAGTELSNNLFNQSFISFSTGQPFLPEIINTINETLQRYSQNMVTLAQFFNVRFIMIRQDIDHVVRETEPPGKVDQIVKDELKGYFSSTASFDKLSFYEISSQDFNQRIYGHSSPVYIYDPQEKYFDLIPFAKTQSKDLLLSSTKSLADDPSLAFSRGILLKGKPVENIQLDAEQETAGLPFVRFQRNSPFYSLVRLKENVQIQLLSPSQQVFFRVNLLGKRLAEITQSSSGREQALEEYFKLFKSVSKDLLVLGFDSKDVVFNLIRQSKVLEALGSENPTFSPKVSEIIQEMNKFLQEGGVKSIFPTDKKVIFRFWVPKAADYEIFLAREGWDIYYQNLDQIELDLDGKNYKTQVPVKEEESNAFSLGNYFFEPGVHEISFSDPHPFNLISNSQLSEISLSSQKKEVYKKYFSIDNFDNYSTYQISFEYLTEKGNAPIVTLEQGSDPVDKKGKKIPRVEMVLPRGDYDLGWKKISRRFTPHPLTKEMGISFKIVPWGDCKSFVKRSYRKYCEDENFNKRFLMDSVTRIRNLKVERVFGNPLFLRQIEAPLPKKLPAGVEFDQISPSRYTVKVSNAKSRFFLVLSTAFDPKWKAYFLDSKPKTLLERITGSFGGTAISETNHFLANGYGNAWFIDKPGNFDLFLEYYPERIYVLAQKLSLLFIGIYLVIVFLRLLRRG